MEQQLFHIPSVSAIELFDLLQIIVQWVYQSYFGLAFAGVCVSIVYHYKGQHKANPFYKRFAADILEVALINKGTAFVLGVLSPIALMMMMMVRLQDAPVHFLPFYLLSIVCAGAGYSFLSSYRAYLRTDFAASQSHDHSIDVRLLGSSAAGVTAAVFLFTHSYFFLGSITLASDESLWGGFQGMGAFWNDPRVWSALGYQFASAFALLSGALLFFFRYENRISVDEDYQGFTKKGGILLGLPCMIITPFMILMQLVSASAHAFNFSSAIWAFGAMAVFFLCFHMVYKLYTRTQVKFEKAVFFVVIVALAMNTLSLHSQQKYGIRSLIAELKAKSYVEHAHHNEEAAKEASASGESSEGGH